MFKAKSTRGHIDNGRPPVNQLIFQEVSRNHQGSIVTYRHNLEDYMTLVEYFTLIDQPLANLIEDVLLVYDTIMVKVSLAVLMENELDGKEEEFFFLQNLNLFIIITKLKILFLHPPK